MRTIFSFIALSALLAAGCSCLAPPNATNQGLAMPNVAHPGTEAYQQARAQRFEPYPENDVGPPVVGGRPREYQDPRPAFAVLQDMHPNPAAIPPRTEPVLPACPQVQVPQAPIAQPPIITPPPAIYYPPGVTPP